MICYKQQTPANPCRVQTPRMTLAVKSSKKTNRHSVIFLSYPVVTHFNDNATICAYNYIRDCMR